MKKVLVLMLVFAVSFAAISNEEGDVILSAIMNGNNAPMAAVTSSFTMGDGSEIIRDVWVGSDFDNDGNKEVMVASYASGGRGLVYEITGDNTATLFFDTGDFGSNYTTACRHIAFGDLDGNGEQELLVSINASSADVGGIWAYEYDLVGDSMRAPVRLCADLAQADRWYVENFTVGDIDGDGDEELLFGNNGTTSATDNFHIRSVESGTFAGGDIVMKNEFTHGKTSSTFPIGGSPYGGVIGDLNGDGMNEALFAPWDHGALLIVECDSADNYTAVNYIQTDKTRADDFAFGDFYPNDVDGDGKDEVYLSMYSGGSLYAITCPEDKELSEMNLDDVHTLGADGYSGGIATQMGDFDGNGRVNIYATTGGNSITVHEHIGGDPTVAANWVKLSSIGDPNMDSPYFFRYGGDLDGDGKDEIYLANTGSGVAASVTAIEMSYEDLDLELTFDDAADVGNWSHYDETNGWTAEAHDATDSVLVLSDGGYSMIAKRPVVATEGWLYKLSVDVKTSLWEGHPLELSVQGLGNDDVKVSAVSEGAWTTLTLMGIAESDSGYIRFYGNKAGTTDTLWVDNVMWDDMYMDVYPSANIAACKEIADYEWVACTGIVTNASTGAPIFMQDETAGLSVYDWDFINDGIVEEGDEILIYGQRSTYKGLVQVQKTDANYQVLSKGNPVVPTLITVDDLDSRDYQGMLVKIEDVDTTAGFAWPTEGNDASITLTDGTTEFTLRIDRDSEVDGSPEPASWPLDLIGVVSEYNDPQVMPRFATDFITNQAPSAFAWINPVDGDTVASMDDPALVDVVVAPGDTAKGLFANWTEAVDEDSVVYQWVFIGEGPDPAPMTTDTFMVVPLDMEKPYDMNGTYNIYMTATDPMGEVSMSDTIEFTFDFPAPPMVVNADVVLVDGAPKYYVEFDMPVMAEVADFTVLNATASSADAATAVMPITPCAVLVTAPLPEDNEVALLVDGVTAPGKTLSVADTTKVQKVLVPFSDAHPEDAAKIIESFDVDTGLFWDPNGSGSTRGLLDASSLTVSDTAVFRGAKAGRLELLDDPAVDGGWYVRLYHTLAHQVKSNSTIMLLVKGTGNVEMRLSLKDTGYEQGPWKRVSLCENDWQVVSFDLANDVAEGWITGNGIVEGETMLVEAIHMRSDVDEDVVLYIDEFTERQVLTPVDITLNVMMHEWLRRGDFNLVTNYVDVAGNFNGWGGTSTLLSDFDGDTTYSVTIEAMPYSRLEFKFRIDGSWNDATAEFPYGGPARTISVRDYDRAYTYWYNNDTLQNVNSTFDVPAEFALHQNYPNPFNPTTMIEFDLPEAADVSLVIYDITGRQIRTLVNEAVEAGYKGITWNGRDNMGNGVATGMYIYRLQAGDFVDVKKMTFMK